MKRQKKYQRPRLKIEKVKLNYFFRQDDFLGMDVFAQSCPSGCYWDTGCSCCLDGMTCFLPDTSILMADGSTKAIQRIVAGEKVISYDLIKKKLLKVAVKQLLIHPGEKGGYFLINKKIKVTGYHRFWTETNGWQPVYQLKVGDSLLTYEGKKFPVKSLKKLNGVHTVYNLSISDKNHNFFAEGVLVHNVKACT
jgi:intein/homing endonuclease